MNKDLNTNATVNIICEEFNVRMLGNDLGGVMFEEITPDQIPEDAISMIRDDDWAVVIGLLLRRKVKPNRINIALLDDNKVLYIPRLIGIKDISELITMPNCNASIKWMRVYRPNVIGSYVPYDKVYDIKILRPGESYPDGYYKCEVPVKPYYN